MRKSVFKQGIALGLTCLSLSMTSLAATAVSYGTTGWVQSGSSWKYIEKNGTSVVDGWKEIDGKRYYFNASGDMLTDTLVKDDGEYYYVSSDGSMVKNEWRELNNNGKGWYYFGPTGQASRTKGSRLTINDFETINGAKYAFSTTGKMLTGWIKASNPDTTASWYDADFYFGDTGIVTEGWKKLKVKPYNRNGKTVSKEEEYWFYFDGGQKVTDSSRYIDDRMYAFDTSDGHMLVDWLATDSNGNAVIFNPENTEAVTNAANEHDQSKTTDGSPYVPTNRETITEKVVVTEQDLVKSRIVRGGDK